MNYRAISVALPLALLLAIACSSREDRITEARNMYGDILGCWSMTPAGAEESPQSLRWIDLDDDGNLIVKLRVELKWSISMDIDDDDVDFVNRSINFGDEFTGRMDSGGKSIQLSYRRWDGSEFPFVLRKVHNADTIRMMKRLYGNHRAAFLLQPVADLGDGLRVADLTEVGADSLALLHLLEDVHIGRYGDIHCLLLVKDGRLFLEEYFGAEGRLHGSAIAKFMRVHPATPQSVSKSVLSAVAGIAIDSGIVPEVQTPVAELLPQYALQLGGEKQKVTMHHLLAMNTGLQWNGPNVSIMDTANDTHRMFRGSDPLAFVFSRPLVFTPGSRFVYNNGCYYAVQAILDRYICEGTGAFAQRTLFTPLGIGTVEWDSGGAPLLRARDLARFALLFLRKGEWNGRRVISPEWIERSTMNHQSPGQTPYGYFWWLNWYRVKGKTLACITAIGDGGQYITMFPELDFALVALAGNYNRRIPGLREALASVILPAVSPG